jgi:hypothetical protein
VRAEIRELESQESSGYDRYICVWAGWLVALVDRDGPALRWWMDRQFENVLGSGLRENWLVMFGRSVDPVRAAELIGACGGSVYRDTASYIHHAVIRDRVVRPRLAPAAFDAAVARGLDRPLAKILAEHGL